MPKMTVTQELRAAQEEYRRLSEEHQRLIGRIAPAIVTSEDGKPMTVVEELCATLEAVANLKAKNAAIVDACKPKPKPATTTASTSPVVKPATPTAQPADANNDTVLIVDGTGKTPAKRVKRSEIKPWWSK